VAQRVTAAINALFSVLALAAEGATRSATDFSAICLAAEVQLSGWKEFFRSFLGIAA
jgi:hypothetical protein